MYREEFLLKSSSSLLQLPHNPSSLRLAPIFFIRSKIQHEIKAANLLSIRNSPTFGLYQAETEILLYINVPCTANEGPVRIEYKCLVPIYVFPEMKLWFPKQNYYFFVSQFIHLYTCERFIYFQDRSAYFAAGKYVDRSWEYKYRSQTHESRNWDWGRAISSIGIHKWNFPCSVLYKTAAAIRVLHIIWRISGLVSLFL